MLLGRHLFPGSFNCVRPPFLNPTIPLASDAHELVPFKLECGYLSFYLPAVYEMERKLVSIPTSQREQFGAGARDLPASIIAVRLCSCYADQR